MNIQMIMKQAQKMQQDMMKEKEEINKMTFEGKASFVTVKFNGNKEMIDMTIANKEIADDEIELLQDMVLVAVNDALKQIDKITEERMGKYSKGMPGLF